MVQMRIGQSVVVDVPATTANIGPGFDCLGAPPISITGSPCAGLKATVNALN